MLGNPFIKPWDELAALADEFAMQEFLFGSWYVCGGRKPERADNRDFSSLPEQLIAAE